MTRRLFAALGVLAVLAFGGVARAQAVDPVARGLAAKALGQSFALPYTGDCSSVATLCFSLQNPSGTTVWGVSKLGVMQFGTDVFLQRDAANTLALRNGTNPQGYCVYNTYTDASNYQRLCLTWNDNPASAGNSGLIEEAAGTGVTTAILKLGGDGIDFYTGPAGSTSVVYRVDGSGNMTGQVAGQYISAKPATVSGLHTCNSSSDGGRAAVTDSTVVAAGNFGAAVAGTGTNHVPVYCDGGTSTWRIG